MVEDGEMFRSAGGGVNEGGRNICGRRCGVEKDIWVIRCGEWGAILELARNSSKGLVWGGKVMPGRKGENLKRKTRRTALD